MASYANRFSAAENDTLAGTGPSTKRGDLVPGGAGRNRCPHTCYVVCA